MNAPGTSNHYQGHAMDVAGPATPEARGALAAYVVRAYGATWSVTRGPRPVVLWGGRHVPWWAFRLPWLGSWLAFRFPEPVQLGSADDREQAMRLRECAVYDRMVARFGTEGHHWHVHVAAASVANVRLTRAGIRRVAALEAAGIVADLNDMGDKLEEVDWSWTLR